MKIKHSFETRIVLLIALITMINYFDRNAISFAIGPLESDLGLNNAQFGLIASGFGIGYLMMAFFGGILVDRYNCIWIWTCGAILWSFVTLAMSLAEGFTSILILRIILGIAEGVHFPALLKTISDWLEPKYRGRALAFGLVGVPLASLLGAPFMSYLILWMGWRGMFITLGCLGFFWALFWLLSFWGKKNPHISTGLHANMFAARKFPWKSFFTSAPFLLNCAVYFVFGYIVFFALIWLPGYLEQTYHTTLSKTGFMVMGPWLAGFILILFGGWISDRIHKLGVTRSRSYPIAAGMALSSVSFFLILTSQGITFDLWMISSGLGFAMMTNAPIYALNADLFPHHAGIAQGIASCFFALAGIISPTITGFLTQISGSFHSAILLVAILSSISSLIALAIPRTTVS